jgi:hypothetical protein
MMNMELAVLQEPPESEEEVIKRLKTPPRNIKITATVDVADGNPRRWVKLTYRFNGKLRAFGTFLGNIADDVWQAGGVVTMFSISDIAGLKPEDAAVDNYDPKGPWRGMFVDVAIKTRSAVEEHKAAWEEAIRDIAKGFNRG